MGVKTDSFRRLVDQVRTLWRDQRHPAVIARPSSPPAHKAPAPASREVIANPGALTFHSVVPHALPIGAPLVVLLHGCGQDPETFATETGWRALALKHNFALLMPGQIEDNNPQRCFNWFRAEDMARGKGESGSIIAMVEEMLQTTHADRKRVFITGLSAGGAMTANLLASCPDIFAGGAVVAGLPAGAARNVMNAMSRMAGRGHEHSAQDLANSAHALAPSGHTGPWPKLSIWHGQDDNVVAPINGAELAKQFATLAGITQSVTTPTGHDGSQRIIWGDAVELRSIAGGQHVYPADAAPEIAKFWGILG